MLSVDVGAEGPTAREEVGRNGELARGASVAVGGDLHLAAFLVVGVEEHHVQTLVGGHAEFLAAGFLARHAHGPSHGVAWVVEVAVGEDVDACDGLLGLREICRAAHTVEAVALAPVGENEVVLIPIVVVAGRELAEACRIGCGEVCHAVTLRLVDLDAAHGSAGGHVHGNDAHIGVAGDEHGYEGRAGDALRRR